MNITRRQMQVFDFIVSQSLAALSQPTNWEICDHFGWRSVNAASEHLVRLEAKGMLQRSNPGGPRGRSRAIVITAEGWRWFRERHPNWQLLVLANAPSSSDEAAE